MDAPADRHPAEAEAFLTALVAAGYATNALPGLHHSTAFVLSVGKDATLVARIDTSEAETTYDIT